MKTMYRALAVMLAIMMVVSFGNMAVSAAGAVSSFSDVTKAYWGYETIMEMTQMGLFKGMTEPIDGVSEFWPERTMSRAEFVTVSVRAMYPSEAKKINNAQEGNWWKGYYDLALEKRILLPTELGNGALNQAMTRQEMAMVMVRCVENNGETVDELVSTDRIADYSIISKEYREYVRKCFSFGLIVGIDEKGTFAPTMSLTRAQAATVLCRLVDQSARVPADGSSGSGTPDQGGDEKPGTGTGDLRWEDGGKPPSQYTYEEYEKLTTEEKIAFQESFGSLDAFTKWLNEATGTQQKLPWENGGKQPSQYTYQEYQNLTEEQQLAFQDSFGSLDAFTRWLNEATGAQEKLPWENGGKQPSQYTYKEYEALTEDQQIAFQESFETFDDFTNWLMSVL